MLRGHCADVGRDYDKIEKTVMVPLDPGVKGEKVDALLTNLQRLAGWASARRTGGCRRWRRSPRWRSWARR